MAEWDFLVKLSRFMFYVLLPLYSVFPLTGSPSLAIFLVVLYFPSHSSTKFMFYVMIRYFCYPIIYILLWLMSFFVSIKHGLCFMFCYSCDYAFNINLTRFMFYVLPDFLNYSHNSATVYHLLQSHFTCTYCQMIWQVLVLCFLFYIT